MQRTLGAKTLGQFARTCGGRLVGADRSYSGRLHRYAHPERRRAVRRAARPEFRRQRIRGSRRSGRRRRRRGRCANSRWPCRRSSSPTRRARLSEAARRWRDAFSMPIVGVAGSNGKTTAKEMTAQILGQVGPCLATRGNLNNHIGVPLTLLRSKPEHRFAVVEMGANRAGEVAALVDIARPDDRPHHQCGRGAPRRLRQPGRRRARRRRDGGGARSRWRRRHQRRRRVRQLWRDMTRAAW